MPVRDVMLTELLDQLKPQLTEDVEVIIDPTMGISIGKKRNNLLIMARGDYIAFVDDDDMVSDDYVEQLLDGVGQGRDPDVCSLVGFVLENDRYLGAFEHSLKYREWSESELPAPIRYKRCPNHLNLVRRELALKAGFLDVSYAEDQGYSKRLLELCLVEFEISKPIYQYVHHQGTASSNKPQNFDVKNV